MRIQAARLPYQLTITNWSYAMRFGRRNTSVRLLLPWAETARHAGVW